MAATAPTERAAPSVDAPGVFCELAALMEAVNDAAPGLPTLQRLVDLAERALGAVGVSLLEQISDGSRVVAASGRSTWSVGRYFLDLDGPGPQVTVHGRVQEVGADRLPAGLAATVDRRGIDWLLYTDVRLSGRVLGVLCAYFAGSGPSTKEQRAALEFLANLAAHVYSHGRGLPLHQPAGAPDSPETVAANRQEETRDLFITATGHELRTPVTVIKGYADTLADNWDLIDEAERRDAAVRLRQRAAELARLVKRLLSAVGDGSPLARVGPIPFDLAETLRSNVDELPSELRRRVRVSLPNGLPRAVGDRAAVATVLAELVTNAVKYSPGDSPVEVIALAEPASVGFQVADRGVGIAPEHVERAFDRFWQGDRFWQSGARDQPRYAGVGLGLYLVRRIVERQNGWVYLRPRERGGTVAEVRLPRADVGQGRLDGR
jgi:two-component system, OmpR family, phosphate regulon sensor histidine kinase PhoR